MTSRRLLKAAQAIREVVSMAILSEIKDPRVQHVTVTKVEVLPDMKQAKVYVTIMGDETQQRLALHGLQNSAGFLQHKIATRIDTRYTPRLEFIIDVGVRNSLEIDRILRRVLPKADDPFVLRQDDEPETDDEENSAEEMVDTNAVSDETGTICDETGTGSDETGTGSDETGTVGDQTGTVGDQTGTVGDQTGTVGDQTGTVGDQTATASEGESADGEPARPESLRSESNPDHG